jgi:hypothetical protein
MPAPKRPAPTKDSEPTATYDPLPDTTPQPRRAGRIVIGGQRRVVLPAEILEHLGVEVGGKIVWDLQPDGSVKLQSVIGSLRELHGIFAKYTKGRNMVDELIAERREEARREEREL